MANAMIEFIQTLTDPDITFLRYAIIAGILSGFSFGIIGTYVVVRRISYIAGAISHCVLGGIGAGLYFQSKFGITWFSPMAGAVVSALAGALIIGFVSLYASEREDSVIGALWATGMAAGLLFISRTPGYIDPMSYLFGNILILSKSDLWTVAVLGLLVTATCIIFYNKLQAVCFDDEFLLIRGIHAEFYYLLLLCLTALSVVLLIRIVGIVMVIALLTLPAAIAGHFAGRLWKMMIIASLLCIVFTTSGLAFSYTCDLPGGPTIIMIAGTAYLAVTVGKYFWSRLKNRL